MIKDMNENNSHNNKDNRRTRYRILWVDEEPDAIGFVETGRRFDMEIVQYRSWDKARTLLNNRFETFAAVVLDGRCVINSGETPNPDFLYQVVREMEAIMASHEEQLPWYVLSSGTAPDFDKTLERISMGARSAMADDWGRLFYRKDSDLQDLCLSIRHAVAKRKDNKIKLLYGDTFKVMEQYFPPDARQTMLEILVAMHYPEESHNFDPVLYYTQLRRVLEHLFRAANRIGVLPLEVMGSSDKINLANSSLYLSGREVNLGQGRYLHYGKPGDAVFPPVMAQVLKNILVVANKNSHTLEVSHQGQAAVQDYYNSLHSSNLIFGYTLHLCDVILWFGRFAKKHTAAQYHKPHPRKDN